MDDPLIFSKERLSSKILGSGHIYLNFVFSCYSYLGKQVYAAHRGVFIALGVVLLACIIVGIALGIVYGRKSNASKLCTKFDMRVYNSKFQESHDTIEEKDMWIDKVEHGISSFHPDRTTYQVYRNVMDFGCKGDGVTDDTSCINTAISSGDRCGNNCGSSTIVPALIYFPSGRYLISSPIIMYYYSQLVGNAKDLPTLVAADHFSGIYFIELPFHTNRQTLSVLFNRVVYSRL